jgi:hypothetical protein
VFCQLDQHAAGSARVEERDTFPFGPDAGRVIDESDPGGSAALEGAVEVVDGKTYVVNAGAALGDESSDGRICYVGLQKLDEGLTGDKAHDAGSVAVVERSLGHRENVAVEGKHFVESAHRDADVSDASSTGYIWHGLMPGP